MNHVELQVPDSALQGVVTVGNFDGVHRGHQQMLKRLRETAEKQSARAVVVTFDPHPMSLLRPGAPMPRLTTIPRRTELLRQYGADEVVVLPVTHELLLMTPDEFFRRVLVRRLSAATVVEGPNFRFGRDRSGDVHHLRDLCRQADIDFHVIQPVADEGRMISSSRIRTLLSNGSLREAVAMTGHAHRISGSVSRGAGRGNQLGFPTANLDGVRTMLPSTGVYAGTADISGTQYVSAVSIGPNPTFADSRMKVECHLVDFAGDLYNQTLDIDLLADIRPLISFDSVEKLTEQITSDVERCCMEVARLTKPVYKICRQAQWQEALDAGEFVGTTADLFDGFIHFSTAAQLNDTAARHFAGQDDLVLIQIDPIRLGTDLRWELSRGGDLFPHLYGPLPIDAATTVDSLPWRTDRHEFPSGSV